MTAAQLLQRLQDGERQLRVRLYVWCDLTVEGGPGDWCAHLGDGDDYRIGYAPTLADLAHRITAGEWDS
jgi:hypothetical protein